MKLHGDIQVSIAGGTCVPMSDDSGATVWKTPAGQVVQHGFSGTTFFYASTKSRIELPVKLTIDVPDRYLFFLWNGNRLFEWQPALLSGGMTLNPFAFQGMILPPGMSSLDFPEGGGNVQFFGFTTVAAQLLSEEFEYIARLWTGRHDGSPVGIHHLPPRFLPPSLRRPDDNPHKPDIRGFALNLHRKETLYQIVKRYDSSLSLADPQSIGNHHKRLFQKALELIRRNFSEPLFSVDKLAEDVGMSRRNLYRLFETHSNLTPQRAILKARLKKARELLQAHTPVGEVAAIVGFNNPTYFSTLYKQTFGISPIKEY